jgi:hypothetical protein
MGVIRAHSESPRWFWVAAIWSFVGLFDATQTVFAMRAEGMQHAWANLFVTLLLSWLPWALATPLVLHLGRMYPPNQWRRFFTWFVHLGASAAIGLVYAAWSASLEELLNPWAKYPGPEPFGYLWSYKFYNGFLSSSMLYGAILLASSMLDSRERLANEQTETARLNEQLSKAQLMPCGGKSSPTSSSIRSSHRSFGTRETKRCSGEHDCRPERLSSPRATRFRSAASTPG